MRFCWLGKKRCKNLIYLAASHECRATGLELCEMDKNTTKCPETDGSEKPPVKVQTAQTMQLF
jgi:hypothetical protein